MHEGARALGARSLPDGRLALVRFWDTRVLANLAHVLDPVQRRELFGHVFEWHLLLDRERRVQGGCSSKSTSTVLTAMRPLHLHSGMWWSRSTATVPERPYRKLMHTVYPSRRAEKGAQALPNPRA